MRATPGNDLDLGQIAGLDASLRLLRTARDKHLYICGSTGTGKSKFIENLIRQDIRNWRESKCGLLLIDPHGAVYDGVVRWLASFSPKLERPIIPIDFRQNERVIAYNLLRPRPNADPSVIVSNFVQAMAHVWGAGDTKDTPRFARWAKNILGALYEKELTLLETKYLIDHTQRAVRRMITDDLKHPLLRQEWSTAGLFKPKEFQDEISSTVNRLRSFVDTELLRLTFGQSGASLDFKAALEEGHIVLLNLATERSLFSEEDAGLLGTLVLSDLWASAKERGKDTDGGTKPFYVYLDEFQNFITPTIAKNLDQARGFGLHLTLANQFPRQILHGGAHGQQVYDSVIANTLNKVVFSTRGEEDLTTLALDLFRGVMNPDEIKHELYSTKVMDYRDEVRIVESQSDSSGSSEGSHRGSASGAGSGGTQAFRGDGSTEVDAHLTSESLSNFAADSVAHASGSSKARSHSISYVPTTVPVLGKEVSNVQFRSLEEQRHRAMSALFDQEQRCCTVRLVGMKTPLSLRTPDVGIPLGNPARTKRYLDACFEKWPFSATSEKARAAIAEREELLLKASRKPATGESESTKRRIR